MAISIKTLLSVTVHLKTGARSSGGTGRDDHCLLDDLSAIAVGISVKGRRSVGLVFPLTLRRRSVVAKNLGRGWPSSVTVSLTGAVLSWWACRSQSTKCRTAPAPLPFWIRLVKLGRGCKALCADFFRFFRQSEILLAFSKGIGIFLLDVVVELAPKQGAFGFGFGGSVGDPADSFAALPLADPAC
jgi:hypothetical protein